MISNLVAVIMLFNTHIPVPMRSMFATPSLVLTNIMACRVYRNTKFGLVRESEISTSNMKENNNTGLVFGPLFAHSTRATADTSYRVNTTNLNSMPFSEGTKAPTSSGSTGPKGGKLVRVIEDQTSSVDDAESQTQRSNNIWSKKLAVANLCRFCTAKHRPNLWHFIHKLFSLNIMSYGGRAVDLSDVQW